MEPSAVGGMDYEAQADDAGAWRGAITQSLLPLHFETVDSLSFRGRVLARREGGMRLAEVQATGHIGRRGEEDLADGHGDFVLCQVLEGRTEIFQAGRTALLRPGDLVVYDSTRPMEIVAPLGFKTRFFTFPRSTTGIAPGIMGELLARRIGPDAALAGAVAATLDSLAPAYSRLSSPSRSRAFAGLSGLVAGLFLEVLGTPAVEDDGGRANFVQLAAYAESHLGDPELGARSIAAAHYVSVRLVHKLFAAEGTSVGAWVRARRLERCREELGLPENSSQPVAALAARCGFASPSHFTTVFRETYAETPAHYRRRVLGLAAG
ncbi:AraC family transcriptional regulator [Paeniglutamicibacter sp. MACA_103]|uniref:AraC family transcriptional regulator n=1 Tax=Paeniglutamicibacter sp. MACA_103 TaxID=3377337 RepID=UPI00389548AE